MRACIIGAGCSGFTTAKRNYGGLLGLMIVCGILMATVSGSGAASVPAAIVSLVLGTLCAVALVRGQVPWGNAIATFMVSPLMLPGLVLGIALLQAARDGDLAALRRLAGEDPGRLDAAGPDGRRAGRDEA